MRQTCRFMAWMHSTTSCESQAPCHAKRTERARVSVSNLETLATCRHLVHNHKPARPDKKASRDRQQAHKQQQPGPLLEALTCCAHALSSSCQFPAQKHCCAPLTTDVLVPAAAAAAGLRGRQLLRQQTQQAWHPMHCTHGAAGRAVHRPHRNQAPLPPRASRRCLPLPCRRALANLRQPLLLQPSAQAGAAAAGAAAGAARVRCRCALPGCSPGG